MNRVESLKQIFPSQKSIADICGVHPVSVTGWKRRDWIPAAHHTRLRAALSGLVRTQFLTDERAQELSRILDAALSGECPHCGAVRR